jgi:hypothetical protein
LYQQLVGGAILQITELLPKLSWYDGGAELQDNFRILKLGSYDGIIGIDWLGMYSPMETHWSSVGLQLNTNGTLLCHMEKDKISALMR